MDRNNFQLNNRLRVVRLDRNTCAQNSSIALNSCSLSSTNIVSAIIASQNLVMIASSNDCMATLTVGQSSTVIVHIRCLILKRLKRLKAKPPLSFILVGL